MQILLEIDIYYFETLLPAFAPKSRFFGHYLDAAGV